MLSWLRNAARSWIAKLLLILLVVSFAVWGISGQILGGLGSNVLSVGNTRVSINEYRLAYDRQIRALSQQFGTTITRDQAQAFGIDNQVLAQLIAGAVLDEQAREMRLGLSRDRLAALTAEDTAFHGPDGRFDRMQFEWVLRQVGMQPDDYLKNREQVAIRQQIVEAVSDGLETPDVFLRAVSLHSGEARTVEFLVLPKSLVEPIASPTDADLTKWFEENRSRYAAPEYRRISYIKLEPSDIADPSVISEEDVQSYYERNRARFSTPERRRVEQLVFANQEAASAALDKIRAGATFDEIVAGEGKTLADVQLGIVDKTGIPDAAMAEAAFALASGGVSEIVNGLFGPVLLRVTEIQPESVRPLAEVADTIRRDLALDEANRVIMDVHDGYEDARAAGDSMAEAAAKQRLQVTTVEAVDRSGRTPDGTILTDLPQSNQLLREVFDSEIGVENAPINIGSIGFVFFEVDEVMAARDRTLDEVRDRAAADWTARETSVRLAERAAEIQKSVTDGGDFAQIASELGFELQTRYGVKRGADDSELGNAGVAAVFGVARGGTGAVPGPSDDAQIVFRVTEVAQPIDAGPDSLAPELRDRFTSGLADDLLDQLVARLQTQYDISIDRSAIQQALSF